MANNLARVGHWHLDVLANEVVISDAWRQLRGISKQPTETIDVLLRQVHDDDRAGLENSQAQLLRGAIESFTLDYRIEIAGGSYIWVEGRANAIKDAKGNVVGVAGCEIDITQRKRDELNRATENERALRNIQSRFDVLAATAPVAIFHMGEDPTDCVYVNDRWADFTQQPTEEALGNGWMQFVHPDHLNRIQQRLADFKSDPTQLVTEPYEVRRLLPDGTTSWVQCTVAKELDDRGNVTGFVGTMGDINAVKQADEKLKELDERLRKVLESGSIGIWEWSFFEQRLRWDEQMFEIYGVDPSDFKGAFTDWTDRIHPDDAEVAVIATEQIEQGQTNAEFRIVRPDGEIRYIYSSFYIEKDSDGTWARGTGINVDVTDRRKAELALLDAQRQITRITDNVPGMIFRYVLHVDGVQTMTYVSPKCSSLFGVDAEEVLTDADAVFRHIHPDDNERVRLAIKSSAVRLDGYDEEFRVVIPGRETEWRKVMGQPTRNAFGDAVWDGFVLDITDRKESDIALQEAKALVERIAENVPGMVYRHVFPLCAGQNGTFISSECQQMFGVSPEDAIEDLTRMFQWVQPKDLQRLREKAHEAIDKLQPLLFEYRVNHPEKGRRWYRTHGQPEPLGHGQVALDGFVLDITEQKHAELELQQATEELAHATKMKDEFLATMSHELRTPLNAILGMTEGLTEGISGPVNDEQLDSLDVIQLSGTHLLDLINDVLDLSKIESGSLELQVAPVNVARLCEESLDLIKSQAEKKRIQLQLNLPNYLPDYDADEKRLRQVIVNLLSNAVKFTPDGGVVKLDVEQIEIGGNAKAPNLPETILRISVTDNGIGIASSDLEDLFDPFMQVDSSLSRKYAGTGLGLSLVKQFVELHAGSVKVTTTFGEGSCFSVDLPLHTTSNAKRPQLIQRVDSAHDDNISKKQLGKQAPLILLAEDNELVAKTTIRFLTAFDYRVELVTDGNRAIEAARCQAPDVILMDVQMPDVDGLEAIRQIRQMPQHEKTPIIALTGLAMHQDASRCLATGADRYLSKPYGMKQLLNEIQKVLSEKAADRASDHGHS